MEVHRPKAIHSWRELVVEIGVIVVGVVIALAAEQVVEALRWAEQVRVGETALKNNFRRVVDNAAELEAQQDCIERRLAALSTLVEHASETGRLPPVASLSQPPFSPWRNAVWGSLVAGGVVLHLPSSRALNYSGLAVRSDYLADLSDREQDQWNILETIVGPGRRLSDVEAETLRTTLVGARYTAAKMYTVSRGAVARIRQTGLLREADFVEARRRGEQLRSKAAICTAT